MIIRPLDLERDRAELGRFLVDSDRVRLDQIQPALAAGDCFALVREVQERPVALAVVHLAYRTHLGWQPDGDTVEFLSGINAYLENLEVERSWWRQGIGSGLLMAVEAEAYRRARRMLWLHTSETNVNAHFFYEHRGWVHDRTVHPSWRQGGQVSEKIVCVNEVT